MRSRFRNYRGGLRWSKSKKFEEQWDEWKEEEVKKTPLGEASEEYDWKKKFD